VHEHPVGVSVADDLRRNRATVFFRILLAIPHFVWVVLWSIAVVPALVAGWVATIATGRLPRSLHGFFCSYIRYTTELGAYLTFVANPYPPFNGSPSGYPLEVRLPEPEAQSRWSALLRLPLGIPVLMLAGAFAGAPSLLYSRAHGRTANTTGFGGGLLAGVSFLGWFAGVFAGRMPRGLRDAGVYGLGYRAQASAYLLLVTDRYPNSDPTELLEGLERPAVHPVRLVGDAHDLRRSRLTVFFRLPLAVPLIVWLALWGIAVVVVTIVQWFVTLFRGRPAAGLHRFVSSYIRYQLHVNAFLFLVANPFPGFSGAAGSYPLDLELPAPGPQSRWRTGFRLFLAIPAGIFSVALNTSLYVAAVLTWFAALATGSAQWGLRNLAAYVIRYNAQVAAYGFLLTDAYPNASPLEGESPVEPQPTPAGAV
jgi:Domain of unknown function (DUF4389)